MLHDCPKYLYSNVVWNPLVYHDLCGAWILVDMFD